MTQEDVTNFNLARKYKINQQILDGFLDASEAISAPSVFVSYVYMRLNNLINELTTNILEIVFESYYLP